MKVRGIVSTIGYIISIILYLDYLFFNRSWEVMFIAGCIQLVAGVLRLINILKKKNMVVND